MGDSKNQEEMVKEAVEEAKKQASESGEVPAEEEVKRISWLVAHHHTYTEVDGIDHQILLEADYLVNAGESSYSRENVQHMLETVFQTESGIRLLKSIYLR